MYVRPAHRVLSESLWSLHSSSAPCLSHKSLAKLILAKPANSIRCPHSLADRFWVEGLSPSISIARIRSLRQATCACSSSFVSTPGRAMSLSASSDHPSVQIQEPIQDGFPTGVNHGPGEEVQKSAVAPSEEDVIVQYIVIRKDLVNELNWPLGSVISQGCHAAVAAIWIHKDDPETARYCGPENLNSMHKVVLEVKGETQLRTLAQKLESEGIDHKVWIERPENYATCLATRPYYKSKVALHFKKLKLCK